MTNGTTNTPIAGYMRCAATGCFEPAVHVLARIGICETHRAELAVVFQVEREAAGAPISQYRSIVYYVTWDKGETVKIGTTTDPRSRFSTYVSRSGRPVDLLAAHPGSYIEERSNHRRFAHLRTQFERERFKQGPDLVDHIANVRAAWPNWKQIVNEVAWARAGRRGKPLNIVANAR